MSALSAPEITKSLALFQGAREGARRFHRAVIGDVDPSHCFADYLSKVARQDVAGIRKEYGQSLDKEYSHELDERGVRTKASLSSTDGPSGGYLVPQELRDDLMLSVAEQSIIRPRAINIPMTTSTLSLPVVDTSTAPTGNAGQTALWGGLNFLWLTDPTGTLPETEPKWRQVELHAWPLGGYAKVSRTLSQDALALDAWLRFLFAGGLAWEEDNAFISGNGAGKPMGATNSPGTKSVSRQTGGTITIQDIGGMLGGLLPGSWSRAIWVCSPSTYIKLVVLNTNAFQINQPYYDESLPAGAARPRAVLGGLPLYVSEKVSILGTAGDLVLLDPGLYVVGDRRIVEIEVAREEPTAFLVNNDIWRIVERVDGQPAVGGTVTMSDGTSTAGWAVVLT